LNNAYAIGFTFKLMAITVTQLTAFLAVIRSGSVTAAADELVVTQPSVSAAVAALGRELGCELLERDGRGIRATEAGREFAAYAADVIGLLERGRQAAREVADIAARRLRIAAVTTAAESFVPPLMHAYGELYPDVELSLLVANRQSVLDAVLSHATDIAITGRPPIDERLVTEPFHRNEIVCITAPDDPLAASGEPVSSAALAERVWLLREQGSGTRQLNEQFLSERGVKTPTLTLGSNGAIRQAARAGLGVSLLSRVAVEAELALGLLAGMPLIDGPPTRPWYIVHSAIGPLRPPVEGFIEFLNQSAVVTEVGL
jgi:LysR family transcriptional regulator, low CO2-responsive transcriptional regulator